MPADLGYYDLRMPEVREAQAEMACEAGVEGFMYWHYWFGNGKRLLERVFDEVLESGKPDFPFCLGWANHSWYMKNWNAGRTKKDKLLIEQTYNGEPDYKKHFDYVLSAFRDKRYIKIDNKPVFFIYSPSDFKDIKNFISLWQLWAKEAGLQGIFFIGQSFKNENCNKILALGFDAVCRDGIYDASVKIKGRILWKILYRLRNKISFIPLNKYDYGKFAKNIIDDDLDSQNNIFPEIIPNFDHSPRSGRNGFILTNSTPQLFGQLLEKTLSVVSQKDKEKRVIFLRSWNEWAEGNYMEPDLKYGKEYLNVLKKKIL